MPRAHTKKRKHNGGCHPHRRPHGFTDAACKKTQGRTHVTAPDVETTFLTWMGKTAAIRNETPDLRHGFYTASPSSCPHQ